MLISLDACCPRRLFGVVLFWVLLCWVTSSAADPLPRRPLVIGCDPDYPPYQFVSASGEPAGFDVELARAIGEVMGVEVELQFGNPGQLRHRLAAGQLDILEGVPYHADLDGELDFAPPHAQVFPTLWVRRGSTISRLEDLEGKRVLVAAGGMSDRLLARRPELRAEAVPTDSLEDALRLLSIGEGDAALGAKLPGEYLLGRLQVSNVVPVAGPLGAVDYGFAVKRGNRSMASLVTEGLALLKQSGRYRELYNKWLGPLPVDEGPSRRRLLRIGGLIIAPLLLTLLLVAAWSRTLKRQVRLRTADLKREVEERQRAMEELKRHQQQLVQADKLTSLGVLVSGVAHEINNPNALLLLNLPQLQRAWTDIAPLLEERYRQEGDFSIGRLPYSQMRAEIPEMLEEMQGSAGRIRRIVEDLKNFARRDDDAAMEPVDLNQVAEAACRLVENALKKATAHFSLQLAANLPLVTGNPQRIEQVVVNLLLNACQALQNSEQAIFLRTQAAGDEVVLEVEDQGCGIAEEALPQLTDPFYTTRREAGGTGLGLSVSAGIVREHNGRLEFSSSPGAGTRVRLSLPQRKEG